MYNAGTVSAAADGTVCFVGRFSTEAYRWISSPAPGNWSIVGSNLDEVAVGSANQMWGTDSRDTAIVVWNAASGSFARVPGTAALRIAGASDGTVIHIGRDRPHHLFLTDPVSGATVRQIDGDMTLDQISIASQRQIWGVREGKVYRRDPAAGLNDGTWTEVPVPEPFNEVTISHDGAVCGIAKSNQVYHFSGS
jgi:hypothetical protein